MIISGLSANERRAETLELSDYYYIPDDGSGLIVLKEATEEYQTADNFNGKTIAVQESSVHYNLLLEQLPNAITEPIAEINDGVKMLLTFKAEALAVGGEDGRNICDDYPNLAMAGFRLDYKSVGSVICMRKGETALRDRINEIIAMVTGEDMFVAWLQEAADLAADIGWQNEFSYSQQ